MQTIRTQEDIASLPQPRFIHTAPAWLRGFATVVLLVGACLNGAVFVSGLAEGGNLILVLGGAIAGAICLFVLVHERPTDWRVWINLAATPDGVYLIGRARNMIFVPWRDVIGIGVEQRATHRGLRSFARLTLRLPEETWSQFGKLSAITGSGAVRHYTVSALAARGEELVARLKAFRSAHC